MSKEAIYNIHVKVKAKLELPNSNTSGETASTAVRNDRVKYLGDEIIRASNCEYFKTVVLQATIVLHKHDCGNEKRQIKTGSRVSTKIYKRNKLCRIYSGNNMKKMPFTVESVFQLLNYSGLHSNSPLQPDFCHTQGILLVGTRRNNTGIVVLGSAVSFVNVRETSRLDNRNAFIQEARSESGSETKY